MSRTTATALRLLALTLTCWLADSTIRTQVADRIDCFNNPAVCPAWMYCDKTQDQCFDCSFPADRDSARESECSLNKQLGEAVYGYSVRANLPVCNHSFLLDDGVDAVCNGSAFTTDNGYQLAVGASCHVTCDDGYRLAPSVPDSAPLVVHCSHCTTADRWCSWSEEIPVKLCLPPATTATPDPRTSAYVWTGCSLVALVVLAGSVLACVLCRRRSTRYRQAAQEDVLSGSPSPARDSGVGCFSDGGEEGQQEADESDQNGSSNKDVVTSDALNSLDSGYGDMPVVINNHIHNHTNNIQHNTIHQHLHSHYHTEQLINNVSHVNTVHITSHTGLGSPTMESEVQLPPSDTLRQRQRLLSGPADGPSCHGQQWVAGLPGGGQPSAGAALGGACDWPGDPTPAASPTQSRDGVAEVPPPADQLHTSHDLRAGSPELAAAAGPSFSLAGELIPSCDHELDAFPSSGAVADADGLSAENCVSVKPSQARQRSCAVDSGYVTFPAAASVAAGPPLAVSEASSSPTANRASAAPPSIETRPGLASPPSSRASARPDCSAPPAQPTRHHVPTMTALSGPLESDDRADASAAERVASHTPHLEFMPSRQRPAASRPARPDLSLDLSAVSFEKSRPSPVGTSRRLPSTAADIAPLSATAANLEQRSHPVKCHKHLNQLTESPPLTRDDNFPSFYSRSSADGGSPQLWSGSTGGSASDMNPLTLNPGGCRSAADSHPLTANPPTKEPLAASPPPPQYYQPATGHGYPHHHRSGSGEPPRSLLSNPPDLKPPHPGRVGGEQGGGPPHLVHSYSSPGVLIHARNVGKVNADIRRQINASPGNPPLIYDLAIFSSTAPVQIEIDGGEHADVSVTDEYRQASEPATPSYTTHAYNQL